VKEGVIASRIAGHAADIARGVKGAWEWDRTMSEARKNLDWEEQVRLCLDPEKARRVHGQRASSGKACSMCGELCALQLVTDFLGAKPEKC
jgi:phosphomethylpyrimidine synthase